METVSVFEIFLDFLLKYLHMDHWQSVPATRVKEEKEAV